MPIKSVMDYEAHLSWSEKHFCLLAHTKSIKYTYSYTPNNNTIIINWIKREEI